MKIKNWPIGIIIVSMNLSASFAANTFSIRLINVFSKEIINFSVKKDFEIPVNLPNQECRLLVEDSQWAPDGFLLCADKSALFGVGQRVSCSAPGNSSFASLSTSPKNVIDSLKKSNVYDKVSKKDKEIINDAIKLKTAIMGYYNINIECVTDAVR